MVDFTALRSTMVAQQLVARGLRDPRVLGAMERVPREMFVPPHERVRAYADQALPIGEGQTISQPFMVALMSESLNLAGKERVLEMGTGSANKTEIKAENAREGIWKKR